MKILYIHGFGSNANGTKVSQLRNYCEQHAVATVHCQSIDYQQVGPDEAVRRLKDAIRTLAQADPAESLCIIGSSLGGFYALQMQMAFGLPTVVLNPSLTPAQTMTGRGLAAELISGYKQMQESLHGRTFPDVRCIICEDDEVLDHSGIEAFGFDLQRLASGGHRMDNFVELLPQIINWMEGRVASEADSPADRIGL
jgi:predicted esterase YcpF (UPF0227 family)